MEKTVLIIEDDEVQRVLLDSFLRKKMNLNAYLAENGRKGLELLAKHPNIKLVISDIEMPVMDGIETLQHIRKKYPHIPVVMLTGSKNLDHVVESMKLGATDFITKPYDQHRLRMTIQNVFKMQNMAREIIRLEDHETNRFAFHHIIGHDNGLQNVIHIGRKAASIDLPVLIQGETGTGKELFARAIHGESPKSGGPFITVNCGAIPSELVESVLFGHEKGAFTGATQATIGKFREADGGSIFLDEVGELPLETQTKLLRVLQEQEVEPVGAPRSVKVNVRIISATHRNLKKDIQNGLFREDLFYRLNVLDLHLPALRERKDDIPALCDHFLQKISVRAALPIKHLSQETLSLFQHYSWPGNIRQLENTLNRAAVLSDHQTLQATDFDLTADGTDYAQAMNNEEDILDRIQTIEEMEIFLMKKSLRMHNNNITKAAQAIGMAKSTFYRKMKHFK